MSGPCSADFQRLAAEVGGFTCAQAHPVIQIRNPFGLTNWTLPVLEALIVGCAVLALIHAVRRFRREGDRIPLVMWCAPVLYLLVIEPPVYFPDLVGAEESMGVVFVHNVFTVEFLWDRLPLYIVAIYPALMVLAYEISVRLAYSLGAAFWPDPWLCASCTTASTRCSTIWARS